MNVYLGWISSQDFMKLAKNVCPHCDTVGGFMAGPRGAMARNILCTHCLMEFNAGPVGAQIIAKRCDERRLRETYGILTVPTTVTTNVAVEVTQGKIT